MAKRRLLKEWKNQHLEQQQLGAEEQTDVLLTPRDEDKLLEWVGYIAGPPDTPYHGGTFELQISVPSNYPLYPPTIRFVTNIFHPNIHFKTGEICLDILKGAWSAAYTLQSVCRSIIVLLANPEPESPLNCDCGNLLRCGDKRGFRSLAKMYTHQYAMPRFKNEK